MLHKRFRQHQETDGSELDLCKTPTSPPLSHAALHALAFAVGNVKVNDDILYSIRSHKTHRGMGGAEMAFLRLPCGW